MEQKLAGVKLGNLQLIEIRKLRSDFGSTEDYLIFREELMCKSIHPWLELAFQETHNEKIPEGVWALIACEAVDGAMITSDLLAFEELEFWRIPETTPPFEKITGFNEWLANFNPTSWGDWLMVPKLFLIYLRTGQNLPALAATPDPFIDAVLRDSRGMLMWTHQFIMIIRMIADISPAKAYEIYRNIALKRPGWQDSLENIHYPSTNQTLLHIFEERTVGMQALGSPEYIQANWLSSYFDRTAKDEP